MKFIHLSDLHIGKHLYHYNMKEDQEHILEEVIGYIQNLHFEEEDIDYLRSLNKFSREIFMINLFRRQRRSQCLTIF